MSTSFPTPPDEAYAALGVKRPGQKWFAFDGSMDDARKGDVKKFVMAVWNFHSDDTGVGFGQWAIVRDESTQTYWYRVAREKKGQDPKNRKSLWNALLIARKSGIPMQALLKDRRTRNCSLEHVFAISQVMQQDDGSALWVQLEASEASIGTPVRVEALPPLVEPDEQMTSGGRSPKLTFEQYSAGCRWGWKVYEGMASRAEALDALEAFHHINRNSAAVLLNNYRCLVDGRTFKAPMSADAIEHYVDEIVARYGDSVGHKVLAALEGYLSYAAKQWGSARGSLGPVAERLRIDLDQGEQLARALSLTVGGGSVAPVAPELSTVASEVLKEMWVRGPQHAAFRRALKRRWSDRCAVHGVDCNGQVRASHIVAWRLDEKLRGDPDNGLFLSVPLDCLFDQGLITFDEAGRLLVSKTLAPETARHFGLTSELRLAWDAFSEETRQAIRRNLKRHRDQFGFSEA